MKCSINIKRRLGRRNEMIYGHFIEHFHRQIYGGVYDPGNPLSDEDGLRKMYWRRCAASRCPFLDGQEAALSPPTIGKRQWGLNVHLSLIKLGGLRIPIPLVPTSM